jgi:hypothetical protein
MQLPPSGGGPSVRHLVRIYRALGPVDRSALIAFAQFLASRAQEEEDSSPSPVLAPDPIARPAQETVVAAIKRLSRSYHMLDRAELLNETSSLMASHVLGGKDTHAVIDEIEALFARHYSRYLQDREA